MFVPPTSSSALPTPSTHLRPRRRHRLASTLVAGALVTLGGVASVASAPAASAHDELTSMTPADRSSVPTTPDRVVLHFTEPPLTVGLAVRVTGPTGDVQQGTAQITGNDVVQPLLPTAPAGAYRVAWRVTADDGHASSGELTFTASAANAREATATPGAGGVAVSPSGAATPTAVATAAPAVASAAATSSGTSPVAIAVIVGVLVILGALALVVTQRSRRAHPRS